MDNNHVAMMDEKAKRQANKSFKRYVGYTKTDYTFGWFNELLCMVLQDAYDKMQAGEFPMILMHAPPRSGKSELGSRRFPAWALGRDPKLQFIGCSYGGDLAMDMSIDTKDIINSQEHVEIFPESRLPGTLYIPTNSKNKQEEWEIVDSNGIKTGGRYRGRGVGGGISGKGFNIGLIDDPVKDYAQAASKAYQDKVINWWNTTFYTRRDPVKHAIIVIMTRWHKHDLAGYLMENMETGGKKWTVVNFPMEAERDENFTFNGKTYHTRNHGDILFPERMPQSFVDDCKTDDLTWSALYQQSPNIAGGNYLKSEYFNRWDILPEFERMIITGDTAQKTKDANDFSVFQVWGLLRGNIYLVDQVRGKWEAHILKKKAWEFWDKWGGGIIGASVKASGMYVEDKVSGTGLIQEMRAGGYDVDGVYHKPVPIIGIPRTIDKITRAIDAQPTLQSGFVYIPQHAPWVNSYLMEFEDFSLDNNHVHDDQIDPTLDAIDILIKGAGGVNYSANW